MVFSKTGRSLSKAEILGVGVFFLGSLAAACSSILVKGKGLLQEATKAQNRLQKIGPVQFVLLTPRSGRKLVY